MTRQDINQNLKRDSILNSIHLSNYNLNNGGCFNSGKIKYSLKAARMLSLEALIF